MAGTSTVLQRATRRFASAALHGVFQRLNPTLLGSRTEHLVRRIGFFRAPAPAEVVANYLRGYLLFGRENLSEDASRAWFHWYWVPERAVITKRTASVPRRLRPLLHRGDPEIRFDEGIEEIIRRCAAGRIGWLTPQAVDFYLGMLRLNLVAGVGAYREGKLVGGLWGLAIGRNFGLMSMFHVENNAGALALAALAESVSRGGRFASIDCGAASPNWDRYGARMMPVADFAAMVTGDVLGVSLIPEPDPKPKTELVTAPQNDEPEG